MQLYMPGHSYMDCRCMQDTLIKTTQLPHCLRHRLSELKLSEPTPEPIHLLGMPAAHAWAIGAACLPLALAAFVYRSRQAVVRRRDVKLASGGRVDSQVASYAALSSLCVGSHLRNRRMRLSTLLTEALGDRGQSSSSILMMPLAELPEALLVHRIAAAQGDPSLAGISSSTESIAAKDSRQVETQQLRHELFGESQRLLYAGSTTGDVDPLPAASLAADLPAGERHWGLMTQSMALQPRELEVRSTCD